MYRMCAHVIHLKKTTGKAYTKLLRVVLSGTTKVILIFFFLIFIFSDHKFLYWKNDQTFFKKMFPEERLPKPEMIKDICKKTKVSKWLSMFKNFTLNSMSLVILY